MQWGIPALIVFSGNRNGLPDAAGLEHTVEGSEPRQESGGRRRRHARAWSCSTPKSTTPTTSATTPPGASPSAKPSTRRASNCSTTSTTCRSWKATSSARIRDNIQHIGHFHTAGNPGRHELDETQELYYPAIMHAIAATDYDGYVGQEFSPKNEQQWRELLEQAYKVCDV